MKQSTKINLNIAFTTIIFILFLFSLFKFAYNQSKVTDENVDYAIPGVCADCDQIKPPQKYEEECIQTKTEEKHRLIDLNNSICENRENCLKACNEEYKITTYNCEYSEPMCNEVGLCEYFFPPKKIKPYIEFYNETTCIKYQLVRYVE